MTLTEWYERWFGNTYLELYPHREELDAAAVVDLVAAHVPLSGRKVLDLGCGSGRHVAPLRARGASVVGLDLSRQLLDVALVDVTPRLAAVRGDMRFLPFGSEVFDVVVSFFTSFGYFDSDEENENVLRGISKVLRKNGNFVIDYLNPTHVRSNLVRYEETKLGSHHVKIARRISNDDRYVIKEIELVENDRSFMEQVRLYSENDLERMISNVGMTVVEKFGSYDGAKPSANSPRSVLIAEQR